jgi:hypothetical protein
MRIFNEDKTVELLDCDLEKGYLKKDVIETDIPEQEEVMEKWHYEAIKEYPNGGKILEKVIDVEGKPYIPAHTEREEIWVYIPYTEDELERMAAEREIAELKAKLRDTDYQAIKYAEGAMSLVEYAETKALRQAWRERINVLEAVIGGNT